MPQFDPLKYSYASRRTTVYGKHGMVCTSQPLASGVGLKVLQQGGNAIDAAVAVAATLPLIEPTSNGLGSDAFALIWHKGKLYGLNASGRAPLALNAQMVRDMGYEKMPMNGWVTTMVPGAPSAWAALNQRFGKMPFAQLLAPAIDYARNGYPVSTNAFKMWRGEVKRFTPLYEKQPEVYGPWMDLFTKNGQPYQPGDLFKNEGFAQTLESLAATNCESYYRGEIMEKIVAHSQANGGYFAKEDFENYHPEWVEPITVNYRGYDVFELPPNGHGITVLMALNMLKGFEMGSNKDDPEIWHKMIEALKLAFVDAQTYVSDPRTMTTKVSDMLSDRYADVRRALIGHDAVDPKAGDPACGDTVYFCAADDEGNMISYIQSNYKNFGSGIVIPGTGISLQNRGFGFSLDPNSDNVLEGGKKAYHTIIPGFLCKDGKPIGPFGVMGGFMQPQGHLQVLVNTIDYHMNPQEALDAPRFQWMGGKKIQLETSVPQQIVDDLIARGHDIEILQDSLTMGRGQIIWLMENGMLAGGTEPRCDGTVATW